MKILLVNPEIPSTFWSFRHALKFIEKKSSEPPLGLLTVAAILPEDWEKRLIDMNVEKLSDTDLQWADYVFITGMHIQRDSFLNVVSRCKDLQKKVVAGGPMCTMEKEQFTHIDYLILNEAEITLPLWLEDLEKGQTKKIYESPLFPDIKKTPKPLWDLLDVNKYASMSMQYSRGCPFNCEFCSITLLNGHKPRTKSTEQFLDELTSLYDFGWRGRIFVVDDNFIGNKRKLKKDLLPALINWSEKMGYPFNFMTETSINLADDEELLKLMVKAGFDSAFIGIESPNLPSLQECGKSQNQNRDLIKSVKKLQNSGLVISGGFIVGFDNDPKNIFEQQIEFIQKSGIVTAMVGLLNAQPGTRLFDRLKSENRIEKGFMGDNMDGSINFIPKMNYKQLMKGYKKILNTIYSHKEYYKRIETFLKAYQIPGKSAVKITFQQLKALFRSFWVLGILEHGRRFFWRFIILSIIRYPKKFQIAITMAIYGFHFRRVVEAV
jgi:radical SAM superfamily enzyme YgiQ (UPF0313 family)